MAVKCFICGKEAGQERIGKHCRFFCSKECLGTYEKGVKMTEKFKEDCEFC